MKQIWVLAFLFYVAIGIGFWNVFWRDLGEEEKWRLSALPKSLRAAKVGIECLAWPLFVVAGVIRSIREGRTK